MIICDMQNINNYEYIYIYIKMNILCYIYTCIEKERERERERDGRTIQPVLPFEHHRVPLQSTLRRKLHFKQALSDLESRPYPAPVFTGIALLALNLSISPCAQIGVKIVNLHTNKLVKILGWGGPGACAGRWLEIGPTCLKEVEPQWLRCQICSKIPFED